MLLQTAWFVGFIAMNRPTGQVLLDGMSKDVENMDRIAVFVFHLLGGFAVDGGDKRRFRVNRVEKIAERLLQIVE